MQCFYSWVFPWVSHDITYTIKQKWTKIIYPPCFHRIDYLYSLFATDLISSAGLSLLLCGPLLKMEISALLHFLLRPFCHTLIGHIRQIFPSWHFCALGCRFDAFYTVRDSTSPTGAEWHNLFSFQIIRLQKCTNNHRFFAPPDGIACICQVWDKKISVNMLA